MNPKITYARYEELKKVILSKLPKKKYEYVISFTNGGNVFASDVAKHLGLPILWINPKIFKVTQLWPGHPLVVDDIFDTGRTWEGFIRKAFGFDLCVLYTTRDNVARYYGELIEPNHPWLHFPWEP